ncbi:AraC family transcriptional regulator [Paenibacillus sp. GSMTC-2017]|uniref:AraC family transcriptional regulator n=1 Tax=Paenibacillus sp. GSMTC-2017 TaxID=2794350 RepID=UPI0018D6262F|nr:AraC family transcriptional regulator [Paenibacillus sp. GSMTC-2017]MBH5318776.1 AraC family transcriptional regulator [Paenibacillus sp. GSMTC-2017]
MEWLDRMNNALNYIETHLTEKIDHDEIAKIACCSNFHFARMFSFIVDVPLSEYIRRRRLTLAAFELQHNEQRVIDIALKYGYESPEAFSRAFKKLHGVMPMSARDKGVTLKAYPRLSFHISIKGAAEMNYTIQDKEAFEMFGVSAKINTGGENPFIEIPAFWTKCIEDGTVDRIRTAAGLGENGQIHAAFHSNQGNEFTYTIGYFMPQAGLPDGFEPLAIPTHTYAIFSTGIYPNGQSNIHELWKRIWSEWVPTCNYIVVGPEFEMTYDRGNGTYEMELWLAVTPKSDSSDVE